MPFLGLASCEDDGPETVYMQYQDTAMTITDISPVQGYVGEQFTLTGTSLGGAKEFVKVFIGDFQGEVLSCSDTKIVMKVPEEAVTGKVFLEFLGKKTATDYTFTVLDAPFLVAGALSGYVDNEVTLTGTGMPATADNLTVLFGETKAGVTSYTLNESGEATLTVKVPQRLSPGKVALTVTMFGQEIYNKRYEVLTSPVVDTYAARLLREGDDMVFTGTGFRNFVGKVKVDFSGTKVIPSLVTETAITAQIPAGYAGGAIQIEFEGFPVVEAGSVQILTVGDVTGKILKNSVQPFQASGDQLADWTLTGFNGKSLQNDLLSMQATNQDSKIFQTVMLPKGKYWFTLEVAECSTTGGRFGVVFAVTKGNGTLPGLSDKVSGESGWAPVDKSNIVEYCRITDNKSAHQETMEIVLTEEQEVTIGFVMQLTNKGVVRLSSVKVALVE